MNNRFALLISAGVGFAAACVMVSHQLNARYAADLARQQAAWQAEKEQWQTEVEQARQQPIAAAPAQRIAVPVAASATTANAVSAANQLTPQGILERLKALKFNAGPGGVKSQRELVRLLDDLVRCGPAALPSIREILASNADAELAQGKGKGKGPPGQPNGLLPSSLRRGLFNALQEIGGPEAEEILAASLGGNSRPDEVLKLARMLEQMAPGKYRDTALAAAQAQLRAPTAGNPPAGNSGQSLAVLAMYGDKSAVDQAKGQLWQADGRLNKEAIDYLQTTLKQENLPLLKELLQNPQITDPKQKEDVMRYVTELAGTDPQANQLWYESTMNTGLPDKAREKAINEMEKRGFQNRDNPTPTTSSWRRPGCRCWRRCDRKSRIPTSFRRWIRRRRGWPSCWTPTCTRPCKSSPRKRQR
jgi:hypothetical protein